MIDLLGPLGALSPVALVALAVVAIYRGFLVPRPFYVEKVAECERLIGAIEKKDEQIAEKDVQLHQLAEVLRTTESVMTALHDLARSRGGNGPEARP